MSRNDVITTAIVVFGLVGLVFVGNKGCVAAKQVEHETLRACIKDTQKPLECRHAFRTPGTQ